MLSEMARLRGGIFLIFRPGSVVLNLLHPRLTEVCSNTISMVLSPDLTLVYVLHPSGLVGRLAAGRVSRRQPGELMVYDAYGRIIEYLSEPGGKVRSWCLLGPAGKPLDGWSRVLEHDRAKVFPFKDSV
jgi:hypothetical protein